MESKIIKVKHEFPHISVDCPKCGRIKTELKSINARCGRCGQEFTHELDKQWLQDEVVFLYMKLCWTEFGKNDKIIIILDSEKKCRWIAERVVHFLKMQGVALMKMEQGHDQILDEETFIYHLKKTPDLLSAKERAIEETAKNFIG